MPTKEEIREYFAKFGRKGGKATARKLTAEQRSEIAKKAAKARWAKKAAKAALIAVLLLRLPTAAVAQAAPKTIAQPKPPASTASTPGRFQIFFNPNVRADTFLVDTSTGRIWRMQKLNDVPLWAPEWQFNSVEEAEAWSAKHQEAVEVEK